MDKFNLIDCLEKFKKGFKVEKNKVWENLAYYIDIIEDYAHCNELQKIMEIVDKNMFTLRAYCGAVYCLIEYNGYWDSEEEQKHYGVDYVCGATFRNEYTGEELFIQNLGDWQNNIKEYNEKLFNIFD